jgi:hypothetical protein
MSGDAAQKLQLRDAIVGVYTGKVALCQVAEKFPRVGRRSVEERVKALPVGMEQNDKQLQVLCAANDAVGVKTRGAFTTWELQQAVAEYAAKRCDVDKISATYGVKPSTLRKKRKEVDKLVEGTPSPLEAKSAATTLKELYPGRCFVRPSPTVTHLTPTFVAGSPSLKTTRASWYWPQLTKLLVTATQVTLAPRWGRQGGSCAASWRKVSLIMRRGSACWTQSAAPGSNGCCGRMAAM